MSKMKTKITKGKLEKILELHSKYLNCEKGGKQANLRNFDLRGADLSGVDLSSADLSGSDLRRINLENAKLVGAYFHGSDLRRANLAGTNLENSDLSGTDLRWAYLEGANFKNANVDFSGLPLWCGSFDVKVDDRLILQRLYHLLRLDYMGENKQIKKMFNSEWLIELANQSHVIQKHTVRKLKQGE